MWMQSYCQAPDRKRNKANSPQLKFNGGLVAWLAEAAPTACSSLTAAAVWDMAGARGLSNKLAVSSRGWKWRYTSRKAVLSLTGCPWLDSREVSCTQTRCSLCRRLGAGAGGSTVHCVVSKKWWVSHPSRGLTLQPALTADKWPTCGGFC